MKKTTKPSATKKAVAKKTTKPCAAKACCIKKAEPKVETKDVAFTVHADKGKTVYLAGDFNAWDPTATKMSYKDGVYAASVKLAAGEYQYKFVIDGTWCADPENVNSVANDQGTFNSVVVVK